MEMKNTASEYGHYHIEHQPINMHYHQEESQHSDRRKSRSRSSKHRKHSSRKAKYSQLILDQNSNPPYVSPSSSSENEGIIIGDHAFHNSKGRGRHTASPHVHFADQAEVLNSSHQPGSRPGQFDNQSATFPDILDALSQADSRTEHPFTGVQEYELAMLEERKRKLLQKLERYDTMIHNQNDEIVKREIDLTEVNSSNKLVGLYETLEVEQAHQESELRTLQDVSTERLSQAESDIRDFNDQAARVQSAHEALLSQLRDNFQAEQAELDQKYSPTIEELAKQLAEEEQEIINSTEAIKIMKERLFELKDNLKNIIVEHANKVSKQEITKYDQEEKSLILKIEEETKFTEDLKNKAENSEKIIQTVHAKFNDQMVKAEKVMSVLKKSKEKITAELEVILSEKNQLTVIHNHREEAYYQLLEETKMMKSALEETGECMSMYKQYIELRSQNPAANIPFTHNKLLNQIIGVDNILEQELEDYRKLVGKLRQQEEMLNQRHVDSSQALGEMRLQFNKALDSAKKLSYEMNKVFAYVSASSS